MNFDFPIENIKFNFECFGSAQITLFANGIVCENYEITDIKNTNNIVVKFTKSDPTDQKSYAELKSILINGFDFTEQFKVIPYTIDTEKHLDAQSTIPNNLYFGYVGQMQFDITHKTDLLTKAAWTLANKEFEYVKLPLKGNNYREKNLHNILRDTKFMFTGSLAPNCQEVVDSINSLDLKDLRLPLKTDDRKKIESWINRSSRVQFDNFDALPFFTYTNGVVDCLNSFLADTKTIYLPTKVYYFYREVLKDRNVLIKDIWQDEIVENSKVIMELPAPWYSTQEIQQKIIEAKNKNCDVALDLTWLPITNDRIDLDLKLVDQIFFSMNKTWPIQDFRPAFRWSKNRISDAQTFQWEHCTYPKISANVFLNLMDKYEFDFIYDTYKTKADSIMKTFDLAPTSVLWFTMHKDISHNSQQPIWPYYYLDDFVCLRKLFDFQGKYFW